MKRFGEKLHFLRKKHHLTLQTLAVELGYAAHSHISQIESGKKQPTVDFVLKVGQRFNVSTDELLRDELDVSIL